MHLGLHHAESREKEKKADHFDRVMIVVGLIAPISLIPQVLKVWFDGGANGISLLTWSLLTGVSFMWALYGFLRKSKALFISNVFMVILNLMVIYGVLFAR